MGNELLKGFEEFHSFNALVNSMDMPLCGVYQTGNCKRSAKCTQERRGLNRRSCCSNVVKLSMKNIAVFIKTVPLKTKVTLVRSKRKILNAERWCSVEDA